MTTEQYELDISFCRSVDWRKPKYLSNTDLAVIVRNAKVREIVGWVYVGGISVVADCLEEAARRLELTDRK